VARNLYTIFVRLVATPQTVANVEKIDNALTQFGEWLRFSGSSWLLDTDHSASDVFNALAKILHKDDSELIIKADPNEYAGWAAGWVDTWLQSKRKPPI
jgi:hypothetical protein